MDFVKMMEAATGGLSEGAQACVLSEAHKRAVGAAFESFLDAVVAGDVAKTAATRAHVEAAQRAQLDFVEVGAKAAAEEDLQSNRKHLDHLADVVIAKLENQGRLVPQMAEAVTVQ